jgi:hypothetical protein
MVRRGIVHHSVPNPGLTHLETTSIQVTMARKPVKILRLTFLPPTDRVELSACFGGGTPV